MVQADSLTVPVVAVVGPTAVGKSALGIAIARRFGGEVVSGDAYQFYRGMDVGTAKTPVAERGGIVHRLIDILEPDAPFSVADYQRLVRAEIAAVQASGQLPVLVGGSGLYVQAALYDYRFAGVGRDRTPDGFYDALSTFELHGLLATRHPALAETIEPENRRRILRMLEIAATASEEEIDRTSGKNPYYPDLVVVGLTMDRPALSARISARVDAMVAGGLVEEARRLYDRGIRGQAAAAIGYRELFAHFDGALSLPQAVEAIKVHTRQYAKRQMTWFRNRMNATWFTVDPDRFEECVARVLDHLEGRLGTR
ncbi:MAG: tRNA (adenosine(37)-N6)-dimethylallyltransferase MiaA [Candidatus Izemoplasmatales bacterium]